MEKYAREEAERLIQDGFVPGEDLMLFLDPGRLTAKAIGQAERRGRCCIFRRYWRTGLD